MYAGIHVTTDHLSLVKDAIKVLKTMAKADPYAEHSALVLSMFLQDVSRRNHARVVKPKLEGQIHQPKMEHNAAYEYSQYRSPFYPTTPVNVVPPQGNRQRSTVEDRTVIKRESREHSHSFAPMSFPLRMDSSVFQPQLPTGYMQHPWQDSHSGDMDIEG